jgi:hypothetical protein
VVSPRVCRGTTHSISVSKVLMRRVVIILFRCVVYTTLSVALSLFLLFAFIQLRQYWFRYRAERLYRDALSIRMRRTSFHDLEPVLQRWNGDVTHSDVCGRQHCDLRIWISQWPYGPGESWPGIECFRGLYSSLGGRGSGAAIDLNVRNGFVWGERLGVSTEGTFLTGDGRDLKQLIGLDLSSKPRAEPWHLIRSYQPREVDVRSFGKLPGIVSVSVTPYVAPEEIQRLSQVNFSCFTSLRPCRGHEGLAPVASAELAKYQKEFSITDHVGCSPAVVRDISRDTEAAAIVEFLADHSTPAYEGDDNHTLQVRLLERIKRADFWPIGADQILHAEPISTKPFDELSRLRPGNRLIVLFQHAGWWSNSTDLYAELCGVLPATPENLQMVRAGAADDERVEPLIEYEPQFQPQKVTSPPEPTLPPPPPPSPPAKVPRRIPRDSVP